MSHSENLAEMVSSWSVRNTGGYRTLREVALSGAEGTALLAQEMHNRTRANERLYFAAALGYGSGDAGIEELRSAATETGPGTTDLRCASLLALAKRVGSDATDDLAAAPSDKSAAVKHYALMCLAAVGNGLAYEGAFSQLRSWLKKPIKQGSEIYAVVYLLRTDRLDRVIELQDLLREHESRMKQKMKDAVLLQIWPGVFTTRIVTQDDADHVRTMAWSWFLDGSSLLEGRLPETPVTYV